MLRFAPLLLLLIASSAEAHLGAFRANAVHFEGDAIVVVSNDGLFVSRDGGETFGWVCLQTLNHAQPGLYPATVLDGDTLLAATGSHGLVRSADLACSPSQPSAMLEGRYVIDVAAHGELFALTSDGDRDNALFASRDEGASWRALEFAFPAGFLTERVRAMGDRIYVSGEVEAGGEARIYAIAEGAMQVYTHALAEDERTFEVIAIDPDDVEHLFLRVRATIEERIFESTDGGATVHAFAAIPASPDPQDRPLAFVQHDGDVYLGNPMAGVVRVRDAMHVEPLVHVQASCLAVRGDDLYVCAHGMDDGFVLGRVPLDAIDLRSLEVMLELDDITEIATCAGDVIAATCEPAWSTLELDLGRNQMLGEVPIDPPLAEEPIAPMPSPTAPVARGCSVGSRGGNGAWLLVLGLVLLVRRRSR